MGRGTLLDRARSARSSSMASQLGRFALVGGLGLVVDAAAFTALRLTPPFASSPIRAGIISTVLAIITNWLGNRYWTFRSARRADRFREAVEFGAASLLGMAVALACLAVSHYLLGFRTVLADNVAKNVVGLLLGSALRFVLYRSWVYRPSPVGGVPVAPPDEDWSDDRGGRAPDRAPLSAR